MKRRLQVFISSTYSDLIAERQAAVSAILKSGHIPAGMELFAAADKSQMETIKHWIDESDVYMLILGGRYGSVEQSSGISYTELEFDYAIQQSKPLFAVVIDEKALEEKVRSGGTDFMEKVNPKELLLFRKKVLSNISSFFEDSKDVRLCVYESLADLSASRELKGWVSADQVVDQAPLFEEIKRLSEENKRLKDSLLELEKKTNSQLEKSTSQYDDLREILQAIKISIPANMRDDDASEEVSLLSLFYGGRDYLVNGFTNGAGISEAEKFYFYNICPKLQIHGLMLNEKVTGARYRRYSVSKEGNAFLAYLDRRVLLKKRTEKLPAANKDGVLDELDSDSMNKNSHKKNSNSDK